MTDHLREKGVMPETNRSEVAVELHFTPEKQRHSLGL